MLATSRLYVNEGAVIHSALEVGIPTGFLDSTWGSSGCGTRSPTIPFTAGADSRAFPR